MPVEVRQLTVRGTFVQSAGASEQREQAEQPAQADSNPSSGRDKGEDRCANQSTAGASNFELVELCRRLVNEAIREREER